MTVYHNGDNYFLIGNSQSLTLSGTGEDPTVFLYGSGDSVSDQFMTDLTVVMYGKDEKLLQYGGDPLINILGLTVGDQISVYALFTGANGAILPAGSHPTAASLTSDGHGGTLLPFAYSGGSIDFIHTSERAVLADASNIVGSVR